MSLCLGLLFVFIWLIDLICLMFIVIFVSGGFWLSWFWIVCWWFLLSWFWLGILVVGFCW